MQIARTIDVDEVSSELNDTVAGRYEAVVMAAFVSMVNELGDEIGCGVEIHSIELDVQKNETPREEVTVVGDVLDVVIPDEGEKVNEVVMLKALCRNRTFVRGSAHVTMDRR